MTCSRCNGVGFLENDPEGLTIQQCICSYVNQLKAHLGLEISMASAVRDSGLYQPGSPTTAMVDRTPENLFLKGPWDVLLGHLKWVLGCKGPMFRFLVTTDEKLRTVYVGSESYHAKQRDKRDTGQVYNSLADLVLGDLDLLIVRLGFLGYKNVAMPGILKEAILLRQVQKKPTWLVDNPDDPYDIDHFAYSPDTAKYIDTHFEIVDIRLDLETLQPAQRVRAIIEAHPEPEDRKAIREASRARHQVQPSNSLLVDDETREILDAMDNPAGLPGPKKKRKAFGEPKKSSGGVYR